MVDDIGGQIHGIGLDSFLQMAQKEKTTCTLKVLKDNNVGYLYLLNGELIDAETEKLKGIEAAYAIIGWEKAVIEIENICEKKNNVINQSVVNIVMEAVKIRDEATLTKNGQQSDILEVTDLEIQIEPTVPEQTQADAVQTKVSEALEVPPEDLDLELDLELEPATPQPEASESEAPELDLELELETPEPEAPVSETPEPKAPEPETPELELDLELEPETPQPEASEPEAPELDLELELEPETPKPEASVSETPEPKAPEPETLELEPETPEPKQPEPEAPAPKVPQPEAPKPEVPEQKAPQPEAPQPEAPVSEKPAPKRARKTVTPDKIIVDVDTELMDEVVKSKKKLLTVSVAVIAAAVIVSTVVVYFITTKGDKGEYQSVLAQVESLQVLEEKKKLLQNFIISHDQSRLTTNAEKNIQEIQKLIEERDFNTAIRAFKKLPLDKNFQKEATSIYTRYLAKYPDGIHSAEIKQKISEIPKRMDDMDYQKVKEAELSDDDDKKIAAYSMYLANHPQGKHHATIEKLISDMGEEYYVYLKKGITECDKQKKWDDCIQFCNSFMITFKNNRRLDEISALKNEIEGKRDLSALKNKADLKGDDYEAAKDIYVTYLQTNPDSSIDSRIQDELAMIDTKIQGKMTWETIAAYSQNQQKDIFDRVQRLQKYLVQNPSEEYRRNAEKIMRQLETEKEAAIRKRQAEKGQSRYQTRLQGEKERLQKEKTRLQQEKEKITAQLKQLGGRFVAGGDGIVLDSSTGLRWCMVDSHLDRNKCFNYESARKYVKGLQTGGYRDWRLPTSSELAGIYKSKPFFPASGAAWYWTSEVYAKGYHNVANIVTSTKEEVFKKEYKDVKQCGAVRAVRP